MMTFDKDILGIKPLAKAWLISLFSIFVATLALGQSNMIKGVLMDDTSNEPLPFVNVVAKQDGEIRGGAVTDFDGKYAIKVPQAGKYDLEATNVGYQTIVIEGVEVNSGRVTFRDLRMKEGITLTVFKVTDRRDLVTKDQTKTGSFKTKEQIKRMAGLGASPVLSTTAGVVGGSFFRGARSTSNATYIDGVRVFGAGALPPSAIEEVEVITGGTPAMFSDVTGGVTNITTRGASARFRGAGAYYTSGYKIGDKIYGLDQRGENRMEVQIAGPIVHRRDSAGKRKEIPLVTGILTVQAINTIDGRATFDGYWKVKDDVRAQLIEDPLRFQSGSSGALGNGDFVRLDDLEKIKFRQNVAGTSVQMNGKISVNTTEKNTITFGGRLNYATGNNFSYSRSLFNSDHNTQSTTFAWGVYGLFTQRFGAQNKEEREKSSKIIKSASYTIRGDFTRSDSKSWDERHRDNFFNYGYYGQFRRHINNFYADNGIDSLSGISGTIHEDFSDSLVSFIPNYDINPEMAKITEQYYRIFGGWDGTYDAEGNPNYDPNRLGNINDIATIQQNGGKLNGEVPNQVYALWTNPATPGTGYSEGRSDQFSVNAMGTIDIKDHEIALGIEYQQRISRSFGVSPFQLWTTGRLLINNHIENLDRSQATIDYVSSQPRFTYERLNASPGGYAGEINNDNQSFFDFNVRQQLGLNTDGTDFIDFDSYSPETYKLEFFSPSELLNQGSPIASYQGYTPYGRRTTSIPTLDDFFNEVDEFGNFTRPIAPFRPIYAGAYIQDKFAFNDLIFNIGLRVDRFDANQPVLKDPYVFFPTVKAGEQEALDLAQESGGHPSNIGDDYVVYVNDLENPTQILGYRSEETWFNAEGAEITSPDAISTATGVLPLLVDKQNTDSRDITTDAFEDYDPQISWMPRISFSFPISDESVFFAHYDILTQRPSAANAFNPLNYMFLQQTGTLNNPNLKPERTIDYGFGFNQALSLTSALKISAFYREQRNQIQLINVEGTFPGPRYTTFGNIDFSTSKGLSIEYIRQRIKLFEFEANYTLSFVEGTGSGTATQAALIAANQPNLRSIFPLSFDQRHAINVIADFHYDVGKEYKGPQGWKRKILEGFGVNVTGSIGSGLPYSRREFPVLIGGGTTAPLVGTINGSNLPWSAGFSAKVQKYFGVKFSQIKERKYPVVVSLEIFNLLNTRNIGSVYAATGNPDDDGYLDAPISQASIASQNDEQSYRELYGIFMNNPTFFGSPRTFRLSAQISF